MINENETNLNDLFIKSLEEKVEDIIPNFRKRIGITTEQIEKIIRTISTSLEIDPGRVLIGIFLLFLQGAASAGAPLNMSVTLGEGKVLEKKNIVTACSMVTGHQFIRRIAEALAIQIGEFAEKNNLPGELAYRINNRVKAETGNNLSEKEMAYCSSFSQNIPNLKEIASERVAKYLAEDYQKRFEYKKPKKTNEEIKTTNKKTTKPKRKK